MIFIFIKILVYDSEMGFKRISVIIVVIILEI